MRQKGFLYELHLHTSETSQCGHICAEQMVKSYRELGYSGIVVTDHFNRTLCRAAEEEHPGCDWSQLAERFLRGYRAAAKAAQNLEFDVILGMELRFPENNNDYLIYGITEDFFSDPENKNFHLLGIREFRRRYKGRLLIVQAHPYRDGNETVYGEYLDGVEVLNRNQRHDNHNRRAKRLAESFGLLETAGSDAHRPEDIGRGAVSFPLRIRTSLELAEALQKGEYSLVSLGGDPGDDH